MCSACGTPGHSMRRSVLGQRSGTSENEGVLQEIGFEFQNAVLIRCEEFVAVSCRSQLALFWTLEWMTIFSGEIWDAVSIWMFLHRLLHYVSLDYDADGLSSKGVWKYTPMSAERSLHVALEVFHKMFLETKLIGCCEWTHHVLEF